MAYLVGTVDYKLEVPRVTKNTWVSYADSDHAGGRKSGDPKSRSGIMLLWNGMPYHWRSNKQPTTAMSSAAAEIVALSECAKDVKLRMFIAEEAGVNVKKPYQINVDNKSAISFQKCMNPDSKLKGVFDLREAWVQDLIDTSVIKAVKIGTEKNLADMLTKPLEAKVRRQLDKELMRQVQAAMAPLGGK